MTEFIKVNHISSMKTKNPADFRRKLIDLIEHYGSEYQVAKALDVSQNTVLGWARDEQKAFKSSVMLVNIAWSTIQSQKDRPPAPTSSLPTCSVMRDNRGRLYAIRHTETPRTGTFCILRGTLGRWFETSSGDGSAIFEPLVNPEPSLIPGPPDHEVMCRLISTEESEIMRNSEDHA